MPFFPPSWRAGGLGIIAAPRTVEEPPPPRALQVAMERAVQDSLVSAKTEQIQRDAEMARALSAEHADMPADVQPEVVLDGSVERQL